MRVIICDDNKDTASTLSLLLSIDRHETFVCTTGGVCVEKASTWRPQVVVCDIQMPGMSGYDVARAIRDMDFGKEILLVALTGYGTTADGDVAKRAGFDLHMMKPADPVRLLSVAADPKRYRGSA